MNRDHKRTLLIYGAGAIGRGYLPWVFDSEAYDFYFVEKDARLAAQLRERKQYTTHKTVNGNYLSKVVGIEACLEPGQETEMIGKADLIVTAVGPRNMLPLAESLKQAESPIICCENDASIPSFMNAATGKGSFVFAIPDVITSNSAPPDLIAQDPLSIVTEDGVCFIDAKAGSFPANCRFVDADELKTQWLAKLFIHNTPHCIAAYLGSLLGVRYLHEALQNQNAEKIVQGAMGEMEQMLIGRYHLDEEFVRWYGRKEIQRFRNVMLFDPISRVAREPFRKLAQNDRLIGAAQLCLGAGIIPNNIMLGIMAAFCYQNVHDPDHNIKYLISALNPHNFLRIIIKLNPHEALFSLLGAEWDNNLQLLKELKNE
jgi:mannitol-1-phosphate 5-dehydrogenase